MEARLATPILRRDGPDTIAAIHVDEGPRYTVRSVRALWRDDPEREVPAGLLSGLRTQVGRAWNRYELQKDRSEIVAKEDRDYQLVLDFIEHEDAHVVDVTLHLVPIDLDR